MNKRGRTSCDSEEDTYKFKPFAFIKNRPSSSARPKSRSGHRIVCDDKNRNFYSFGGYNPALSSDSINDGVWPNSRPLFQEVWQFNITRREWTKLNVENIPHVLASNCVTLQGNLLIVFGGTGVPFGSSSSNDLYICDLSKIPLTFRFVPVTGDLPEPRYGQALHSHGKYLYVIGGTTGFAYSLDVHRLDLSTMEWKECFVSQGRPNEPGVRYRHEIAADDDKIYILGGGTTDMSFGFQQLPVFHLNTNSWSSVETEGDENTIELYPRARRFHCAVTLEATKDVFIMGGFDQDELLKDTWKLNLKTMKWTKMTKMKLLRAVDFQASSITPSGKIYLFGGTVRSGEQDVARISEVWSAWPTIPSLQEMCWEALADCGALKEPTVQSLTPFLPPEFARRI